jgi:hypothetical protein
MSMSAEEFKKAAAEMDALEGTGRELEGLTPTHAHISPSHQSVFSMKLDNQELAEIEVAATAKSQPIADFIHEAALKEARNSKSPG